MVLMALRYIKGNPITSHPKSMFQLCGVHYTGATGPFRLGCPKALHTLLATFNRA